MKNGASVFLKQIVSVLSSIAKAKSTAIKSKTTAMKTPSIIFALFKHKKVLIGSITHKIHALLGQHYDKKEDQDELDNPSKAIVLYDAMVNESSYSKPTCTEFATTEDEDEEEEDDKCLDLTHSLLNTDELDFMGQASSVIDMVRNSKDEGEDFKLEDEIDHVADLFIKKFHRQMKMQKMESFKRFQEMLDRSV